MFSKKSAVAAAVLLASVAAQAQVSVYGNVDAFFGRVEAPFKATTDAVTAVESGVMTGSYIGFKGQEDLGGNLKAFFVLESEIGADIGSAGGEGFWKRTSELGLAGDFGTIKLGNSRSLGFLANAAYNPFPVTGMLNTSQVVNPHGNYINAVTYMSPNLSGFTAAVQLGMSEADGTKNDTGLSLNYGAGPLAVGFTYSTEIDSDLDRWQLGASYDFGVLKGFAQVGQNKFDGIDEKQKMYQLGVSVPVSAQGTFLVSYAHSKVDDLKTSDFALAYDHALSKRTSAYIALNNLRVKVLGNSETGNSFGVGIKHAF